MPAGRNGARTYRRKRIHLNTLLCQLLNERTLLLCVEPPDTRHIHPYEYILCMHPLEVDR
jgi:hypothetical protein